MNALNENHRRGRVRPHIKQFYKGHIFAQSPKKVPAATRTPMMAAPTPVTLRAPLPPLKEPVGVLVGEVLVFVPVVVVLLMVVPRPVGVEVGVPPVLRTK